MQPFVGVSMFGDEAPRCYTWYHHHQVAALVSMVAGGDGKRSIFADKTLYLSIVS